MVTSGAKAPKSAAANQSFVLSNVFAGCPLEVTSRRLFFQHLPPYSCLLLFSHTYIAIMFFTFVVIVLGHSFYSIIHLLVFYLISGSLSRDIVNIKRRCCAPQAGDAALREEPSVSTSSSEHQPACQSHTPTHTPSHHIHPHCTLTPWLTLYTTSSCIIADA